MIIKAFLLFTSIILFGVGSEKSNTPTLLESDKSAMVRNLGNFDENYILKVSLTDEPFILNVTLYNNSAESIYLPKNNTSTEMEIEVTDKNGDKVKSIQEVNANKHSDDSDKKVKEGSWKIVKILPKESTSFQVDLKNIFQLKPGIYSVTIKKNFYYTDSQRSASIQSAATKIEIK